MHLKHPLHDRQIDMFQSMESSELTAAQANKLKMFRAEHFGLVLKMFRVKHFAFALALKMFHVKHFDPFVKMFRAEHFQDILYSLY